MYVFFLIYVRLSCKDARMKGGRLVSKQQTTPQKEWNRERERDKGKERERERERGNVWMRKRDGAHG